MFFLSFFFLLFFSACTACNLPAASGQLISPRGIIKVSIYLDGPQPAITAKEMKSLLATAKKQAIQEGELTQENEDGELDQSTCPDRVGASHLRQPDSGE